MFMYVDAYSWSFHFDTYFCWLSSPPYALWLPTPLLYQIHCVIFCMKKKKNPWCCNIEVNRKCWVLNIEHSKQQFQQTFHISKTKYSKGTQIHNLPLEIWKDKIKQLNFYLSTKLCDLNFGGGCCFQFRLHVLKKSEN